MPRYAFLLRANANRVFGAAAADLAGAELELLGERVLRRSLPSSVESISGVEYVLVEAGEGLGDAEWEVLANLSGLHAAFEVEADGRFRPVACPPRRVLDEDIVTIQRYTGKTNEAFTHLLVNLALAAADRALPRLLAGERVRLLDPVCGRGTTLNRAALYGIDAFGIEVESRDVAAYDTFITTWLKDHRMKHTVERAARRKGRTRPAHRITIRYGPSRDTAAHRVLDVVHDDSRSVREHHKARSVDLLVADLPYGVQHASASDQGRARGPEALLADALQAWVEVLRPGGGVALAWNRRTLERSRFVELASVAGVEVWHPEDDRFAHRVDRAITRDVLVGHRPV